jgi:hypothetical protein
VTPAPEQDRLIGMEIDFSIVCKQPNHTTANSAQCLYHLIKGNVKIQPRNPRRNISSSIQETKKKSSLKSRHKKASNTPGSHAIILVTRNSFLNRCLATSNITGVLALGVVGLAEEVVDPLEEVLEREALGESLAGLAVGLVAGAGGCGDGSVEDRRGE